MLLERDWSPNPRADALQDLHFCNVGNAMQYMSFPFCNTSAPLLELVLP